MPPPALIVVRPRAQAEEWVGTLRALGLDARALPMIEILPAPEPERVAAAVAEIGAAAAAAGAVAAAQPLVVFVSPNAVEGCFAALAGASAVGAPGPGTSDADPAPRSAHAGATAAARPAWPAGAWAAATGPGTVAALRAAGVDEARIVAPPAAAAQFDSESLWARIGAWPWRGRPVWIVRGNGGRDWLANRLVEAGAELRFMQSYQRAAPRLDADERALLDAACAEPARWTWMFSSSEAIEHLRALVPAADWRAGRALATHPRIAERARALGFGRVDVVAPTAAAVAAACEQPNAGSGLKT
jgi:uroporphyrinogen-III synthase